MTASLPTIHRKKYFFIAILQFYYYEGKVRALLGNHRSGRRRQPASGELVGERYRRAHRRRRRRNPLCLHLRICYEPNSGLDQGKGLRRAPWIISCRARRWLSVRRPVEPLRCSALQSWAYSPALKHPAARVQHDHLASLWERLMQLER